MNALNFRQPDRLPRFESFWPEFTQLWRQQKRLPPESDLVEYYGIDMVVVAADETIWPTRADVVERRGSEVVERSGWGAVHRHVEGAQFFEELAPGLVERVDPDSLVFDDPLLDIRYTAAEEEAMHYRQHCAVFCKTGGPYLRAAFIRGIANFLCDIAEDPDWTRAFVERVTDHITQVGVEQIRRFGLQSTGIGIYDDVATKDAPVMGRDAYERIFLPSLSNMVSAYKRAGATKVFHHCDGYVEDLLDLWVAAGVDAVNPLEPRTGMDPGKILTEYGGKLAVIGGLDNCGILPRGNPQEIREHVLRLIELGRAGGFILAAHSIGPDVSVETYDLVSQLCREYGRYSG